MNIPEELRNKLFVIIESLPTGEEIKSQARESILTAKNESEALAFVLQAIEAGAEETIKANPAEAQAYAEDIRTSSEELAEKLAEFEKDMKLIDTEALEAYKVAEHELHQAGAEELKDSI